MQRFGAFFLFAAAFTLLLGPNSRASDYHSPRTAALGGAGHAGPLLTDAIYMNPSFISFLPTYAVGMSYQKVAGDSGDPNQEFYGRGYNVSIQDGRTEAFQAGLGYTHREDQRIVHVTSSKSITPALSFGAGGKLSLNYGENTDKVYDATAAVSVIPASWLNLSFMADNILESEGSISRGFTRQFILGTKFNILGRVMLYGDPHYIPALGGSDRLGWEAGAELTVLTDVFIRAGHFMNNLIPYYGGEAADGIGMGIGWVGPKISIDYGFQRILKPRLAHSHLLGATVYF